MLPLNYFIQSNGLVKIWYCDNPKIGHNKKSSKSCCSNYPSNLLKQTNKHNFSQQRKSLTSDSVQMFYFPSILNARPPEIPQHLLLKSLKEFLYTAAHFVHSPYLEFSLTWPEDVPSLLHDCGAGGAVDKLKSGLAPQTCCSALREKNDVVRQPAGDADWPSGCKTT